MAWPVYAGAVAAVVVVGYLTCAVHLFLTPSKREFNRLKNRTALPTASDIDPSATLDALLARGDDRQRWSQDRAAEVEAYVVRVEPAGIETANCLSFTRRDTHVELALRLDAAPTERLIAEVTPPMRDVMARQGTDWSEEALARAFLGRRVRVRGWLLFDREHDREAENTNPANITNWRRTAWEIHPITEISVVRTP